MTLPLQIIVANATVSFTSPPNTTCAEHVPRGLFNFQQVRRGLRWLVHAQDNSDLLRKLQRLLSQQGHVHCRYGTSAFLLSASAFRLLNSQQTIKPNSM